MKTGNAVKTAMMAALSAASSFATETVIDYDLKVVLTNAAEDTVTLVSIDRTAYPEGLPEPSFWFDAHPSARPRRESRRQGRHRHVYHRPLI